MSFEQKELRIFLNVVCYIYIYVITYHILYIVYYRPHLHFAETEPQNHDSLFRLRTTELFYEFFNVVPPPPFLR
jgi:hypothetical protein